MDTRLATIAISTALGVGVLLAILAPAQAEPGIGSTAVVHNDVTKNLGATSGILGAGEDVYRDEAVKTGRRVSSTKLIFLDSTNLSIGPLCGLVLDRFGFNSDRSSKRWLSISPKACFASPPASWTRSLFYFDDRRPLLGCAERYLDVAVDGGRTRVTLVEASAIVCPAARLRRPAIAFISSNPGRPPSSLGRRLVHLGFR